MAPYRYPPGPAAGYSLVELAVVLCILGVLGIAMTSAFDGYTQGRDQSAARAQAETARQALRAFALRNHRLPCPDTSNAGDDGREAGGGNCPAGSQTGWLPYLSLDLSQPARGQRIRYGVRRGNDGDLAEPAATSADDADGSAAFDHALRTVAAASPSIAHPYHGPVSPDAEPSCGAAESNPAFMLAVPVRDLDEQGGDAPGFDGANRGFAAGTSLCAAPPDQPSSPRYDDVVATEAATTLLGWMAHRPR